MIKQVLRDIDFKQYRSGNKSGVLPGIIRRGGLYSSLLCIFIFSASLFLPWTQTIRGYGRVIAYSPDERVQSIDSPINGRLGRWFVEEGSFVRPGDPVVEVFDNDPELLKRLQMQREAMLKNREAVIMAMENSKNNYQRLEILSKKGIVSRRDFEKSNIEYSKFVADEAKVSAELLKLETKIARQSTQRVTASREGYIQRRLFGSGTQLVKEGESLALLVPETPSRSVEVFLSGQDAPFVDRDHKVRIQFEGWPAIQSFGWPSLAKGTFGGKVAFVDRQLNAEGNCRILVVPDPEDEPWPISNVLRQGGRIYAWVLLNDVSLGFELWRHFNGFPPIVSQEDFYKKIEKSKTKTKEKQLKSEDSEESFLKEDAYDNIPEEGEVKGNKESF